MQSGKGNAKRWVLEFEPGAAPKSDPLMGWTGTVDPSGQVQLFFEAREQAIAFARSHGIPHQIAEPVQPKRVIKSYGDNFAFRRREPWSH